MIGCSKMPSEMQRFFAGPPTGNVWGGPVEDERLKSFEGRWEFGSFHYENPEITARLKGGPDIVIRGHLIGFRNDDELVRQLRLCQINEHDGRLCCEAWRIDAGDNIHRQQCTLEIKDGELLLRTRPLKGRPYSDDPVFAASAESCRANEEMEDAGDWGVLHYVPKSLEG